MNKIAHFCSMSFQTITENHIALFKNIVGENFLFLSKEEKSKYASDHTEDFFFLPEIVLQPANENEVSEILKICNQNLIPVTIGNILAGGIIIPFIYYNAHIKPLQSRLRQM